LSPYTWVPDAAAQLHDVVTVAGRQRVRGDVNVELVEQAVVVSQLPGRAALEGGYRAGRTMPPPRTF
jgi:hypothetical protein